MSYSRWIKSMSTYLKHTTLFQTLLMSHTSSQSTAGVKVIWYFQLFCVWSCCWTKSGFHFQP